VASKRVEVPANGRVKVELEPLDVPYGFSRCEVRVAAEDGSVDAFPNDDASVFTVRRSDPERVAFIHVAGDARSQLYFGAALAESIGGATAATTGQDPRGRKIDGKRDPKLEPDPSLPAGVPATNVPVTTAILPPILLAAIPLPPAGTAVVPLPPSNKGGDSAPAMGGPAPTPGTALLASTTAVSFVSMAAATPPQSGAQQIPWIDPKSARLENAAPLLPIRDTPTPAIEKSSGIAAPSRATLASGRSLRATRV